MFRRQDKIQQPVKENEVLEVEIKEMGIKGDGIAFVNGYAIFIPNSILNKKYEIKITKIRDRFGFAEIIKEINNEFKEINTELIMPKKRQSKKKISKINEVD